MNTYPQFYLRGAKCIVRENDTYGKQIEIPEPKRMTDLIHTRVTLPDKSRFDKIVDGMDAVPRDVYERYIAMFYLLQRKKPKLFRVNGLELLQLEIKNYLTQTSL